MNESPAPSNGTTLALEREAPVIAEPDTTERAFKVSVLLGSMLTVVQALYLLFAVYSGLSLSKLEMQRTAPAIERIGSSVATHVNFSTSAALVLAALLLASPAFSPRHASLHAGVRTVSTAAVRVLAVLMIAGSVLAVRSTIFFLPPLAHHLTASQRWELIGYVIGTAGTALVALVATFASKPGGRPAVTG